MTLYPKWEAKEYSVVFKDADGDILKECVAEYSSSVEPPVTPTYEGYAFVGWDSDEYLYVSGNVTITAKYLPEDQVIKVSLNKTSFTMMSGLSVNLTATVTPDTAEDKSVVWHTSDDSVATVNDDGTVTAISVGTVIITAESTVNGAKASCTISIIGNPSLQICLSSSTKLKTDSNGYLRILSTTDNRVNGMMSNFLNQQLNFVDRNGSTLSDTSLIGTGTKIQLVSDGNVFDEITAVKTGDLNGDGLINNRDAAMITRYLVNKETPDTTQLAAMDVNGDGYINNRDASMLSRYLVGKETI